MDIEQGVRMILREHGAPADLPPALPLGTGGLGLDSIAIVEVLLACEDRFGVAIAADLVAREQLTVRRLAEHVRTLVAS